MRFGTILFSHLSATFWVKEVIAGFGAELRLAHRRLPTVLRSKVSEFVAWQTTSSPLHVQAASKKHLQPQGSGATPAQWRAATWVVVTPFVFKHTGEHSNSVESHPH